VGGAGLAVAASTEPGEADGDSAADGFGGGEVGMAGEEEDGGVAGGLEVGDVGAVEVDGGGAGGEGDLGADKVVVLVEVEDVGDGELGVEIGELHGGMSVLRLAAGVVDLVQWT